MANIKDIDKSDIISFLEINHIYEINNIYDVAFNLMNDKNTKYQGVPNSIIEWMLAYNALQNNVNIQEYTNSQLNKLNKKQINWLSNILNIKTSNLEIVRNILSYMHKITINNLRFEDYDDLYINLLINSDYDTILNLIIAKPNLKEIIPSVVKEKLKEEKYYISLNNILVANNLIIKNFIIKLFANDDIDLVEKLLPVILKYDTKIFYLLALVFYYHDVFINYIKYLPLDYDIIFIDYFLKFLISRRQLSFNIIYAILTQGIDGNPKLLRQIMDYIKDWYEKPISFNVRSMRNTPNNFWLTEEDDIIHDLYFAVNEILDK